MVTALLVAFLASAPKLSPFTAVQVEGDVVRVRFENVWYRLAKLDGVETKAILAYCRRTYGDKWEKRFAEDLVEVLEGMGQKPGATVSLELIDPASGKLRKVPRAAMTHDNRRSVRHARRDQPRRALDAKGARSDLAFLRTYLERSHSYRFVRPEGLAALEWKTMPASPTREEFALHVARSIARFGDGHTRVRARWDWLPRGYAPFVARVCGQRLVALELDGKKFVARHYPYLRKIDGVPVNRWMEATGAWVSHGSAAFRRWHGARDLVYLAALRRELDLPARPKVRLTLADARGRTTTVSLPLRQKFEVPRDHHRGETRRLDGNIGYLRLASMDDGARFLAGVRESLRGFGSTRGIVIDVRGNTGGSRAALRLLLPCFLKKPRVVNAAVLRLPEEEGPEKKEGHLASRHLYPKTWTGWSDRERGFLIGFARTFRPQWEPPPEHFTSFHYMVVSPAAPGQRRTQPVVVLMNGGCFSATDIFLGAFKGVPGVTLLGTTSGGGSGRSRRITLPASGVRLRVSSMASFQPDGKFYDGHGIDPDVVVEATPEDWIGETDGQLEAAVRRLMKK